MIFYALNLIIIFNIIICMISSDKHFNNLLKMLKDSHLKCTSQRISLLKIIFADGDAHYTVDDVYKKARKKNIKISLATVYNNLNAFKDLGMLKVLITSSDTIFYDTNLNDHHHFFCKKTGKLLDIDSSEVVISKLPNIPSGRRVGSVNVIVDLE